MRPSAQLLAEENLIVPALAQHLDAVHEALQRIWQAAAILPAARLNDVWCAEFTTAVGEIGANIAEHAHPPGRPPGTMCLRLRLFGTRLEARFADDGIPFTLALPALDAAGELAEGGYGLRIVRSASDLCRYRRTPGGLNVWRLVKYFPV